MTAPHSPPPSFLKQYSIKQNYFGQKPPVADQR